MRRSNPRRLIVTILATAGLLLVGSPAHAFPNAFYPTQSTGTASRSACSARRPTPPSGRSSPAVA